MLALAPVNPAHAAVVKCSRTDVISTWEGSCDRTPDDDDPGGVSGFATLQYGKNPGYSATVQFIARDEIMWATNHMSEKVYFELQWWDDSGKIHRVLHSLEPGENHSWNQNIREGRKVAIFVSHLRIGTVAMVNLKA
ncbi:hypothetical protein AB0I53_46795 [Saccharopolyspora sp. NPDC050389]|uniref:hypothetical protein n=1 Tax=Saccharopolyspora sp. NPDC050389 TaxID=3155516 RepID=UPI0033D658B0